jgi:hypothetical protein
MPAVTASARRSRPTPAALDLEVGRPEPHELADADAGVGQRPHDDLVPLGGPGRVG